MLNSKQHSCFPEGLGKLEFAGRTATRFLSLLLQRHFIAGEGMTKGFRKDIAQGILHAA